MPGVSPTKSLQYRTDHVLDHSTQLFAVLFFKKGHQASIDKIELSGSRQSARNKCSAHNIWCKISLVLADKCNELLVRLRRIQGGRSST